MIDLGGVEVKDKCVDCENTYNPKCDFCRRCELDEIKMELLDELAKSWLLKQMVRLLNWISKVLG